MMPTALVIHPPILPKPLRPTKTKSNRATNSLLLFAFLMGYLVGRGTTR